MGSTAWRESYDERYRNDQIGAARAGYWDNFLRFIDRSFEGFASAHQGVPKVLDVGCGNGDVSSVLAQRGYDVSGVDFSPEAVKLSRERIPAGQFSVCDLESGLPFDDGAFDAVWCSEVLEHLLSPAVAAAEIRRVLRPGGMLLVTVPYHGLLKNVAIALFAFEKHYSPTHPHIRFYTERTLSETVSMAGFRVDSVGSCGSNLGFRDVLFPTNILLRATAT